jgi:hypothetical protein
MIYLIDLMSHFLAKAILDPILSLEIGKNRRSVRRTSMHELTQIPKLIGTMPVEGLVAFVILAAFALAGLAIYAVMTIAKGRSDGPA